MRLSHLTIISGGQTGVDRAALDFAIAQGIAHGGWCPRWRLADDGSIPERYRLTEHNSEGYSGRTRANVQDSDATILIAKGKLTPGTKLPVDETINLVQKAILVLATGHHVVGDARILGSALAQALIHLFGGESVT